MYYVIRIFVRSVDLYIEPDHAELSATVAQGIYCVGDLKITSGSSEIIVY